MHHVVVRACILLFLLLAGCASPGPAEREARRLALISDVAGEPVESFHFWRLDRWESLGREHVMVWTRLDRAFLLRIDRPCPGLQFATTIGLSSSGQRVYQRFDAVLFEGQRCRIAEIRPVDIKALKAAEKARPQGASV